MDAFGAIVFLSRDEHGSSPFFQDILFDPAALWLSAALSRAGVKQFLVVCDAADREKAEACFPVGTVFVTTGAERARERLLSFLELCQRTVVFTKPVFALEPAISRLREGRPALSADERAEYAQEGSAPQRTGVFELTTQARQAISAGADFTDALGDHCSEYEGLCFLTLDEGNLFRGLQIIAKRLSVRRLQNQGVRFIDPSNAYISPQVQVGEGTVILPGTILRGKTAIGRDCEIGPNTVIRDCTIGERVTVNASQLNESTVDDGTVVGPFAYIRPGCHVGKGVKVGDFVELKNSAIGDGTKISHLTYVGDTDAGEHINFGCGTVTVNYDGEKKFRTTIGDHAFIGCNTNLVAPVTVGEGAYTAAGSTITDDVPADSLAIARDRQVVKKNWAKRSRKG